MEFRRLPPEKAAVRRYVEELWLPYQRDLEAAVDGFALVDEDDEDIVETEMAFRIDVVESDTYRILVAIDPADGDVDGDREFARVEGDLVGFVATDIDRAPEVFDRPDRLLVGDIYVERRYRGGGLARELMGRAADRARELECPELTLDVDVDNERAVRFYDRLGFETVRHERVADVDDLPSGER